MTRCKMPKARTIALLVAAAISLAPHNNSVLAETRPCRSMEYELNPYTICEVDLRKHMLRLYWKNSDGTPYAYLSCRLLFATNAGMFDPRDRHTDTDDARAVRSLRERIRSTCVETFTRRMTMVNCAPVWIGVRGFRDQSHPECNEHLSGMIPSA